MMTFIQRFYSLFIRSPYWTALHAFREYEYDLWLEHGTQPSRWHIISWLVYAPISALSGRAARLYCRWRGHSYIDDGSYAGPESGADHFICKRCGESWSHTYY